MKRLHSELRSRWFAAAGVLIVAAGAATATAADRKVVLSPGTVVAARLDDALSSDGSAKGDTFMATVKDEDRRGEHGSNALPVGTKIWGFVRDVHAKHDKSPGTLDLAFKKIILPSGATIPITGCLIGLDTKSVKHLPDGTLVATKEHRTSRLTYVGYGAGAGFAIGLLTGKHRPVQDTAIGAGLGYLYGALEKGKNNPRDVRLKRGTQVGVRLDNKVVYRY
jgi:hypothetical protein